MDRIDDPRSVWAVGVHMSARAYIRLFQSARILKLARTIADPSASDEASELRAGLAGSNGSEGSATIQTQHLAPHVPRGPAIQYRPRRQL